MSNSRTFFAMLALLIVTNLKSQTPAGFVGIGTNNPQAKLQINHRSSSQLPSLFILDSLTGLGPAIRFQRLGLDSFFTFSAGFDGPPSKRGMILSWIDDSLLWVKSDGRLGLGTGNPLAKMQVNHKGTNLFPHFSILDSIGGTGSMISFRKQGVLKDLTMTGIPGATRTDMKFRIDSLIAFTDNKMGIFTESPQHEIDLNGDVNIAKSLLLNGNSGAPGQVLRSNGATGPPNWAYPDTIDIDTIAFKVFSNIFFVNGGSTGTVTSTTEKYDIGNVHNPSTGITTLSVDGIYMINVRGSFNTSSTETGPFLLEVILEVLNSDNSVAESIEHNSALPGNMPSHTSNVSLHTQLQLQAGQKLRVKVSNTRPTGGVNSRVDEFSAVLL